MDRARIYVHETEGFREGKGREGQVTQVEIMTTLLLTLEPMPLRAERHDGRDDSTQWR